MVIGAAAANAGVPDLTLSTAAAPGIEGLGEAVTVYCSPAGAPIGFDFTQAKDIGGGTHDATITLTLRDGNGDVIPNFPAEDMWIDSSSTDFFRCAQGTIADANTDAAGMTDWQNALLAGGFTAPGTDMVQVYVNGGALNGPPFDIQFNSADVTSDGQVTLADIGGFAQNYYGAYAFRSDLVWDGNLTLADIGRLAQGNGTACP
jgi:hypothetical protein